MALVFREMKADSLRGPKAKLTIMQYQLWKQTILLGNVIDEGTVARDYNLACANCWGFTAVGIKLAKTYSKLPLYP